MLYPHFHKEQKQYTLVLNGKIKVTVKDLKDKNSELQVKELQATQKIEQLQDTIDRTKNIVLEGKKKELDI